MPDLAGPLTRPLTAPLASSPRAVPVVGVGYSAEAVSLFARMTTPPSSVRARQINTLIGSLKAAGVWQKLDCLYLLGAADSQASRLCWPNATYDATVVGSPTFVADKGWSGDGATNTSWLLSNFNPITAVAPKFTQNNSHMGVWSLTDLDIGGTAFSAEVGGTNSRIQRALGVTGQAAVRPHNAASVFLTGTSFPGHAMWSRSGATAWASYANGVANVSGADASAVHASTVLRICGATSAGVNQIMAAHWGSNLTGAEAAALYGALATYKTAIGA